MQIISRRENEAIVIDNDIVVTVLEFEDDFVRLAIESPHQEPSYREEVIHLESEFALNFAACALHLWNIPT